MTPTALEAIIILAAKYGPQLALNIVALFKSKEVTVEQVEQAFANLKPYEAYGIPEVVTTGGKLP